jgi:flagellin-like protein
MLKMKKAVSPLIATVLLLAFSIALGAMVMNFSESSTHEITEEVETVIDTGIKCSVDLPVRILRVNNEKLVCYNRSESKNFEFILENQGDDDVDGIRIFLLDSENQIKTEDIIVSLPAHDTVKYNISTATVNDGSSFVSPPIKALISPLIKSDENLVVCDESRIDLEDIRKCT